MSDDKDVCDRCRTNTPYAYLRAGKFCASCLPEVNLDPDEEQARLEDLMSRAQAAFLKMTPEEQADHRREQAISFAAGNLAIDRPDLDLAEIKKNVARHYDRGQGKADLLDGLRLVLASCVESLQSERAYFEDEAPDRVELSDHALATLARVADGMNIPRSVIGLDEPSGQSDEHR